MKFMVEDDGIRTELIQNMGEEMSWLLKVKKSVQKKVMGLFMEMGKPDADFEAIMTELMSIP